MHLLKVYNRFRLLALSVACLFLLASPSLVYAQNNSSASTDSTKTAAAPTGGAQPKAGDPAQVDAGKSLFSNNCAQCHAVTNEVVVGPGLQGINERQSEAWLLSWIKNSTKVVQSGDPHAVEVYNKFNKVAMPNFALQDEEIRGILAYIKSAGAAPAPGPIQASEGSTNAAAGGGAGISSDLFIIVVVALMVVLLLVLVVLVMVVTVLTKAMNNNALGTALIEKEEAGKVDVGKVTKSTAFKAGAAILFVLIAGKGTLDGLYDVGVQQGYAPKQPIAYSHKLHAGQYQIQCRYCHTGVNVSKSANIPSANICMNCHNTIKRESPEIQKIYTAIEQDKPIEWVRVHNLPDLAYFNHAQHVNVGGVQCQQCHGEIQTMEVVEQRSSLTMGWCIDCHRKTDVNTAGNAYYDKLVALHKKNSKEPLKVMNIGGLECSKCHY